MLQLPAPVLSVPHPIFTDRAPVYSLHEALHMVLSNAGSLLPQGSGAAVHAARKEMKRARAVLRLMRGALGETAYRHANRRVRNAARPFMPVRDAAVLLRTLERLRKPGQKRSRRAYADHVRRVLQAGLSASHRLLTQESLRGSAAALQIVDGIAQARISKAPDLPIARRGVNRIYQSGRTAFAKVRRRPSTERLHEWRKQVQYLYYAIDLMHALFPVSMKKAHRRARKLAALLGDDRDLAVLHDKLHGLALIDPGGAARRAHKRLGRRIKARRHRLQAKASRIGQRLYRRTAREFKYAFAKALRY